MKHWPILLVAGLSVTAGVLLATRKTDPPFPHETHERLFPLCVGCHVGVVSGRADELFPEPASCAQCHDGVREPAVEWEPPASRASNMRFFHPDHDDAVAAAGEAATCASCHVPGTAAVRMNVVAAQAESCLECHAHAAETHLAAGVDCLVCHVPLPEADRILMDQVASFPWPASHDDPGFLSGHAPETPVAQASCSVCHARETCERCHANADRLAQIESLDRDPRVAMLEIGRSPEYPIPASHVDPDWRWAHGRFAAAEPATCTNCHTRPSCTGCHTEGAGRLAAIQTLPDRGPGVAPGVELARAAERVHPPGFGTQHGAWAATGSLQCTDCHARQYCSDCHVAADSRAFHPPNFLERHALEVFTGGGDCQSCHSTQTFCQDCHVSTGIASGGRQDVAFHTGQPLWLLSHGQAARMGLESCASCHRQADCLACHSATGGWGVNPHGPGFDPSRIAARNRITCRWCHLGDPLGGQ